MTSLKFTLAPEGIVRMHDAISCLARFNETIGLEARRDKVGPFEVLRHRTRAD